MSEKLSRKNLLILNFCTLWFFGKSPIMPGTCGSFAAILLAYFLFVPFDFLSRLALIIVIFFAGAWACTRAEEFLGKKDPGSLVIDELVGIFIMLLPVANPSLFDYCLAFVIFRIFDIIKIFPVKICEEFFPKGYGVMVDDVVAALQGLLIIFIMQYFDFINYFSI